MDPSLSFTIVTAVKNGFDDFKKTIPTVLNQTDRDFEWIIVDDESIEPIETSFPELSGDSRVRIFRNSPGKGQTASLNLGIQEGKNDWIVRMDADDLCELDRLALIRKTLSTQSTVALVFSDYSVIDESGYKWATVKMRSPVSQAFFSYLNERNNPICHPTVAFRRKKMNGSIRTYREDLVNAQDYALWREIFAECGGESFVHLPCATIAYRIARNSLSGARAKEQEIERLAIREGRKLKPGDQSRPVLGNNQKNSMQAYRLLYYRFIGQAEPKKLVEDLALLHAARHLPLQFLKAFFYMGFRPLRKPLLKMLFGGIYE